ncbi:hypothetical protein BKA70DRAFT_1221686 [Coprinopsis sp. MPI-PUGE-AT-0042]|nr:hypothetical protein BKA70DRAFT_1221686 [Coprinopsis sp. MPI-PUGE-AT-0042]
MSIYMQFIPQPGSSPIICLQGQNTQQDRRKEVIIFSKLSPKAGYLPGKLRSPGRAVFPSVITPTCTQDGWVTETNVRAALGLEETSECPERMRDRDEVMAFRFRCVLLERNSLVQIPGVLGPVPTTGAIWSITESRTAFVRLTGIDFSEEGYMAQRGLLLHSNRLASANIPQALAQTRLLLILQRPKTITGFESFTGCWVKPVWRMRPEVSTNLDKHCKNNSRSLNQAFYHTMYHAFFGRVAMWNRQAPGQRRATRSEEKRSFRKNGRDEGTREGNTIKPKREKLTRRIRGG